jgi:Cu+-exporting ATPase
MEHDHPYAKPDIPVGTASAKEPICGMTVAVKPEMRHAEVRGETFHYCSEKCQTKFEADPWFYASGRATGRKTAAPANVQ